MQTTRQKEFHKYLREEKKKLESILHPCPIINGIEILHEHLRNGSIRFTAWVGDNPIKNGKQLVMKRGEISRLYGTSDFNELYKKDFEWLSKTESE